MHILNSILISFRKILGPRTYSWRTTWTLCQQSKRCVVC